MLLLLLLLQVLLGSELDVLHLLCAFPNAWRCANWHHSVSCRAAAHLLLLALLLLVPLLLRWPLQRCLLLCGWSGCTCCGCCHVRLRGFGTRREEVPQANAI